MSALFGAATVVRPAAPGCSATSEPCRGARLHGAHGLRGARVCDARWARRMAQHVHAPAGARGSVARCNVDVSCCTRRVVGLCMTSHICAGTAATSAPGLPPHLRRDCRHICAGTAATSAPGLPPNLRRDCPTSAPGLPPHLRRDLVRRVRRVLLHDAVHLRHSQRRRALRRARKLPAS
jgi:hypothetical protein